MPHVIKLNKKHISTIHKLNFTSNRRAGKRNVKEADDKVSVAVKQPVAHLDSLNDFLS